MQEQVVKMSDEEFVKEYSPTATIANTRLLRSILKEYGALKTRERLTNKHAAILEEAYELKKKNNWTWEESLKKSIEEMFGKPDISKIINQLQQVAVSIKDFDNLAQLKRFGEVISNLNELINKVIESEEKKMEIEEAISWWKELPDGEKKAIAVSDSVQQRLKR